MPPIVPASRPRLTEARVVEMLEVLSVDRSAHPVVVVGIRGYYRDSMGEPKKNDRGIYDDAIFILTPTAFASYNGNTDPSTYREGQGFGNKKGMASLDAGPWYVHRFDKHRGRYLALCQKEGPVTVTRDGETGPYKQSGYFGINIHRGAQGSTSSEGCQTIHPDQWESFISLAKGEAKRYFADRWKAVVVPYVLFEQA